MQDYGIIWVVASVFGTKGVVAVIPWAKDKYSTQLKHIASPLVGALGKKGRVGDASRSNFLGCNSRVFSKSVLASINKITDVNTALLYDHTIKKYHSHTSFVPRFNLRVRYEKYLLASCVLSSA
jgi:hypothetical protein